MNDMVDMSRFIEAKSDQLNADDLIGVSKTITVTRVTGSDGDQPVSIFYQGDGGKPFKPCKTMRRVLMAVWGRHGADYVGKSMTLYRDDRVTFGGLEVGGIRISHMSDIEKETIVVVMKTKGKKAGLKILPLRMDQQRQQQGGQQAKRQTPEEWTDQYVADVEKVPVIDALIAMQNRAKGALARLEKDHPALFARAVDAENKRARELSPPDHDSETGEISEDDPFATAE